MKSLLLLIAIGVCAYYFIYKKYEEVPVTNYQLLLKKLDKQPASFSEVKTGFNQLATQSCQKKSFINADGVTISPCSQTYFAFKSLCEESVLGTEERTFADKKSVTQLAEKFLICVGVS